MLSNADFIRQSLEIHLFFARIMKEHSFFLEAGFTPRDANFAQQADAFQREFDGLLAEAISLSNGVVSGEVLQSGEVVTPYTLEAERVSSFYTGIPIQTGLTQAEAGLMGGSQVHADPILAQRVFALNQRAVGLISALAQFKTAILTNVITCRMFTVNYPLLIDHILREAQFYLQLIQRIQRREEIGINREILEQELFWNRIMGEHAKFIRGLLDPTEVDLLNKANYFGDEFDELTAEARTAADLMLPLASVTDESLIATKAIRDFKAQGTQGLVECKIRSIILPLLGDHTLREANHYLRLLQIFERETM